MSLRAGILRRARLRRESGGAAIFIVAVTLALLASLGVYGLTSTANDIAASGLLRQSTQAQHADEAALMAAAESFTPSTAAQLVRDMKDPIRRSNQQVTGSGRCKSANAPTSNIATQDAEACRKMTEQEMYNLSKNVNEWVATTMFDTTSFGSVVQKPVVTVEVTNPVEVPGPAGNSLGDGSSSLQSYYSLVTATVYVDMRTSPSEPVETAVLGRGLMTIGPYSR